MRTMRRFLLGFSFRKRCAEMLILAHEFEKEFGAECMRRGRAKLAAKLQ